MAYKPWSREERALIVALHEAFPHLDWKTIGLNFDRSASACSAQYYLEKKAGRAKAVRKWHRRQPGEAPPPR